LSDDHRQAINDVKRPADVAGLSTNGTSKQAANAAATQVVAAFAGEHAPIFVVDENKNKIVNRITIEREMAIFNNDVTNALAALKDDNCDEVYVPPRHIGRCTQRYFENTLQNASSYALVCVARGVGDLFIVQLV